MKIHPDQLKALQDLSQSQKGDKTGTSSDFAELLQNRLDQERRTADESQAPRDSRASTCQIHAAMQTSPAQSQSPDSGAPVMEDIDLVLQQWEKYSRQLASPETSIRESYATLRDIQSHLQRAQQRFSDLNEAPQQLASLLNELEVLVQTEEIKVNRGDYF